MLSPACFSLPRCFTQAACQQDGAGCHLQFVFTVACLLSLTWWHVLRLLLLLVCSCYLTRLIDKRFHGIARGVGESKIVGRIHQVGRMAAGVVLHLVLRQDRNTG